LVMNHQSNNIKINNCYNGPNNNKYIMNNNQQEELAANDDQLKQQQERIEALLSNLLPQQFQQQLSSSSSLFTPTVAITPRSVNNNNTTPASLFNKAPPLPLSQPLMLPHRMGYANNVNNYAQQQPNGHFMLNQQLLQMQPTVVHGYQSSHALTSSQFNVPILPNHHPHALNGSYPIVPTTGAQSAAPYMWQQDPSTQQLVQQQPIPAPHQLLGPPQMTIAQPPQTPIAPRVLLRFTPEIDKKLIEAVTNCTRYCRRLHDTDFHKAIAWSALAQQELPGFSGVEVRQRYCRYLNPHLKHGPFTPEEDKLLMDNADKYEYAWSMIARKVFDNKRSDIMLLNRFKILAKANQAINAEKYYKRVAKYHRVQKCKQQPIAPKSLAHPMALQPINNTAVNVPQEKQSASTRGRKPRNNESS